MKIQGESKLLRIFIGESDKIGAVPVYEKIVIEARQKHLAVLKAGFIPLSF